MSEPESEAGLQRLQKIIASAGIASRRKAEELITEGRVQVNGQTVTELGTKADPARDHIRVDGKLLQGPERPRYFVVNKPKGYVTTASDPEGRPTVMDLVRGGERVFPVGRLDYTSEGLLLMTNDGALANALTRAAARVEKTYLVKVSGTPSESALQQIRHGIMIDRGSQIKSSGDAPRHNEGRVMTAPARIRLMRDADNPWYELVLIEGRNREIRKMFEEIGHHVEKIRRVGYGPLILDVEPGRMRELTLEEVELLRRATTAGARSGNRSSNRSGSRPATPGRPKSPRSPAALPKKPSRNTRRSADSANPDRPQSAGPRRAEPSRTRPPGTGSPKAGPRKTGPGTRSGTKSGTGTSGPRPGPRTGGPAASRPQKSRGPKSRGPTKSSRRP